MNVEKAFLQSRGLLRDINLRPPKEAVGDNRTTLWRLKTAVYGLADAAREWCLSDEQSGGLHLGLFERKSLRPSQIEALFEKLEEISVRRIQEGALLILRPESRQRALEGVLCMHVDDLYITGNRSFKPEYRR